ncbi:MAG: hypothetical protein AAF577_12830 [Pseudomonadota bacterium]
MKLDHPRRSAPMFERFQGDEGRRAERLGPVDRVCCIGREVAA